MFKKIKEKRRMKKIEQDLPSVIDMLANCVRAGLSIHEAIDMTSTLAPKPLDGELKEVLHQMSLGCALDDALTGLKGRVNSPDVWLLVESIIVLKRAGGNIVEMFQTLSSIVRERQKIEGKIRVILSQGLQQAIVILVMPFALVAVLAFVSRWYIAYLFSDPLGWCLVLLALSLQIAGALWLKKIISIKV